MSAAAADAPARMMLVTAARTAYLGLLGRPATRCMGAVTVYASLGAPLRIGAPGGAVQRLCAIAAVPAYAPHVVATEDRHIAIVQIEPETARTEALVHALNRVDAVAAAAAERIRAGFAHLPAVGDGAAEFDRLFFGRPLPARPLDPRIAAVIARISADPAGKLSAEASAALAGLSFSRFMHLFTEQTGTTFRRFRAWKRARTLLTLVKGQAAIVDTALDTGYADSTHFSHSIRKVYGMPPREMIAGSRRLELYSRWPGGALRAG
ncbi:MAG: helix-turn-helix transcriptional regulator [Nevskia sp.]|nr:helix-turn-helix transcriptional regulator [Nevskia sp.]